MSFSQTPARNNIFDEHGFRVILDYGHNPAAIQAMTDLVGRLEVTGRRIVVLAAAGDRRDEDIAEMCRIAAKAFKKRSRRGYYAAKYAALGVAFAAIFVWPLVRHFG